ncbi:MAG: ABC transporter permease [Actinomycetota bacterium]
MSETGVPNIDQIIKAGFDYGSSGAPVRRKTNRRKASVPYLLSAPAVLWLILFFLVPTIYMFTVSLDEGLLGPGMHFAWKWSNYSTALTTFQPQLFRAVEYALLATIVTLLVGYPVAYWISFYGGRRKNVFLLLLLVPFFVSFVLRTYQWAFLLSDQGIVVSTLRRLGVVGEGFHITSTGYAVVFGIAYNFLPFTVLPLYVALERIEPRLLEAGRDLYADRNTTFRKVVWPLALPGVFAAFLLTFVPAVGDFINFQYLGGPSNGMIGNNIQVLYRENYDYPHGAALSFVLMAVLLVGASLYARALGTEAVMEATAA